MQLDATGCPQLLGRARSAAIYSICSNLRRSNTQSAAPRYPSFHPQPIRSSPLRPGNLFLFSVEGHPFLFSNVEHPVFYDTSSTTLSTTYYLPLFSTITPLTMDTVRSLLQPVTHNLPAPIRDIGVGLLGDTCYKALVLDVDETNVDCIKLAVSKGLGVGIVAASAVVKVPQILNLVRSRSAAGL